jgi:V/A-type H+/Na+-transporting ATPase subunit E
MSDTKLQELIETLKKQGVETGEESSRKIVEEARKQAADIVAKAQGEAEGIVNRAQAEANKRMEQLKSSMEIAASQFVTSLKQLIEKNLLALPMKKALDDALADTGFLKGLLEILVKEYSRHSTQKDLEIIVSKDQQEKLASFAMQLIAKNAETDQGDRLGVTLRSENVDFGFLVGKADGNVRLDFTSDAFQALFLRFLSPRFRELFKDIKLGELAGK